MGNTSEFNATPCVALNSDVDFEPENVMERDDIVRPVARQIVACLSGVRRKGTSVREKTRKSVFLASTVLFLFALSLPAQGNESWGRADSFTFEEGIEVITPSPSIPARTDGKRAKVPKAKRTPKAKLQEKTKGKNLAAPAGGKEP